MDLYGDLNEKGASGGNGEAGAKKTSDDDDPFGLLDELDAPQPAPSAPAAPAAAPAEDDALDFEDGDAVMGDGAAAGGGDAAEAAGAAAGGEARPARRVDGRTVLYIANLAWWVSDADVEEAIRECIGEAGCGGALRTPPSFPVSAHNGKSLGYCFVDLEEPLDAQILVDNCNMPEESFGEPPKADEKAADAAKDAEPSKAGKPMVFFDQKASVVFYEVPRAEPVHEPPPVQPQPVQYSQQQAQAAPQQGYQQQQQQQQQGYQQGHQQRRGGGGRQEDGRRWKRRRR